jgi:DNA-binding transcriptional MerR regulator
VTTSDDITTGEIAALLGLNTGSLRACIEAVPGVPPYRLRGHIRVYSRLEIKAWIAAVKAQGIDPAELFREAYRRHQAAHRHGDRPDFHEIRKLQTAFLSGDFSTAEQKQALASRRQQADARQNRERVIQRIRPDWF